LDDTQWAIMDETMKLIINKGYAATTTKDIAKQAGVNECTIFRKFKSKKDIVLCALEEKDWVPNITKDTFGPYAWDLQTDLEMFLARYIENVTTDLTKLSIGLRAPQIYDDVADKIMKIPLAFTSEMQKYFRTMHEKNKIVTTDFELLSTMLLSLCFSFVFFKASFDNRLVDIDKHAYIKKSVATLIEGIK